MGGQDIIEALHAQDRVKGLTHSFYKYPARFSPGFARAVIEAFTRPGELVLDPFVGGGTSVVEAVALRRRAIGIDVNELAVFITRAKTNPLGPRNLKEVERWLHRLEKPRRTMVSPSVNGMGQSKGVPWWLKITIARLRRKISALQDPLERNFLCCALLKTGQWALDCSSEFPSSRQFIRRYVQDASEMICGMKSYVSEGKRNGLSTLQQFRSMRRLVCRSVIEAERDARLPKQWLPAKLVLTSPPYPGVHVLYHRWQIHGRAETPAPYWITGLQDGFGGAFYTLGDRKEKENRSYFRGIRIAFQSIRKLVRDDATIVQLISFSNPDIQLSRYLAAMSEAGFSEVSLLASRCSAGRAWRSVPGRKWYAQLKPSHSAREVLLIHKPA